MICNFGDTKSLFHFLVLLASGLLWNCSSNNKPNTQDPQFEINPLCGTSCGECDAATWACDQDNEEPVCLSPVDEVAQNIYTDGFKPAEIGRRQAFNPDDYSGDDVVKISEAISRASEVNGAVVFNRIYEIDRTIGLAENVLYTGGGLRRACTPHSIVQRAVQVGDRCLSVDSTEGYKVGRGYKIVREPRFGGIVASFIVESVLPAELKICARDPFTAPMPSEGKVVYSFPMLGIRGGGFGDNITIDSMVFDGNSDCNGFVKDWRENSTLFISGLNTVKNSLFYDTPNENITSCGAVIENNVATNLGGSFVHKSCPPDKLNSETIANNYIDGSNIAGNDALVHSEGLITFSANAGNMNLEGNTFKHGNEGVFGFASTEDRNVYASGDCYSDFPHLIRYLPGADESTFSFDARLIDVGPPIRAEVEQ